MQAPAGQTSRVMIVTSQLTTGGLEEVILTYARLLDRSRFSVAVVCLEAGRAFEELQTIPDIMAIHIAARSRIKRFLALWKVARSYRPHIVHNHACWYGLLIGTLVGARRVETIHNLYHWFTRNERFRYGMYLRAANAIIAVSEAVRKFTREFFPFVPDERVRVIHNGIRTERFARPADSGRLRAELGIRENEVVVGFVGRLTEQKGLIYLLEASAMLCREGLPLRLVVVGEGELGDQLKSRAHALGLDDAVFTGYRRDIPDLLALFNVFVLPSLWEGLPVVVGEAMAAACPVIATRVSGTAEIMVDGVTGYLVDPKDPGQLGAKLALLARDASLRSLLGANARARVREHFRADAMVRQSEALYEELMAQA